MDNVTANMSQIAATQMPSALSTQAMPGIGQDLFGFLNFLLQQQTASPQDTNAPAAGIVTPLSGEIASPPLPPDAALRQLLEKIAAMLEKGKLEKLSEPVLPTILPPSLSAEMAPTAEENMDKLAVALNEVTPGAPQEAVIKPDAELSDIIDAVSVALGDPAAGPALDPALLQQLQDKISQLMQLDGKDPEAVSALETDIYKTLLEADIDPAMARRYLAAAQKLAKESVSAVITTPTGTPHAVETDIGPAVQVIEPAKEKHVDTRILRDKNAEPGRLRATDAAVPATPASPPTPSKPATSVLSPGVISTLANKDAGGFGSEGFGANAEGRAQDLALPAGLKIETADAASRSNFSNYLTQARGAPGSVSHMVALQLQRNIAGRVDSMSLQLTPADLGKLDIRLKFGDDGEIRAHLRAEKPETLALLQKDAHHLERVLRDSGLNIDEKSLSFDLQHKDGQHNLEGYMGRNQKDGAALNAGMNGAGMNDTLSALVAVQSQGYITQSGVNIMV